MYRDHSRCRACGSANLIPVFDLGLQPLANDFRKPGEDRSGFAPLSILLCKDCTLAQLSVVVNHHLLYDQYSYVTSPTETMKEHFQNLLYEIEPQFPGGTVLEIGSNDGAFLEFLHRHRFEKVVGIDPAENLALPASQRGIKTITDVFDHDSAKDAKDILGQIDIVIARHVFAHVDDWPAFISAIEDVSHPETLVCIECPYCYDMLEKNEWDTVYHEHLSYVTVTAMDRLLSKTSFRLHKVIKYPIHGGSILMILRRKDSTVGPHVSVENFIEEEKKQTDPIDRWRNFEITFRKQRIDLMMYVRGLVSCGNTVIGFGASAKSTVAINSCKFTREQLRFVTDTTSFKQGRLIPGTDIPVVPEAELLRDPPDYAVCFVWNFREEILKRQKTYREHGGKFIFFVPKVEIV